MPLPTDLLQSTRGGNRTSTTTSSSGGTLPTQLLQQVNTKTYKPTPQAAVARVSSAPIKMPQAKKQNTNFFNNLVSFGKEIKGSFITGAKEAKAGILGGAGVALQSIADLQKEDKRRGNDPDQQIKAEILKLKAKGNHKKAAEWEKALAKGQKRQAETLKLFSDKAKKLKDDSMKALSDARVYERTNLPIEDPKKFSEGIKDPKWILKGVARNAPNLLASLGISAATLAVTRNPAAAAATGFGSSFSMESGAAYNDAREFGAKDEVAQQVGIKVGVANGLLDSLPIIKLLNKGGGNAVRKSIVKEITKRTISQALTEGTTESIQEIVSNSIAKVYDENRGLFAGVPESLLFGGILGGGAGAVDYGAEVTFTNRPGKQAAEGIKQLTEYVKTKPQEQRTEEEQQLVESLEAMERGESPFTSYQVEDRVQKYESAEEFSQEEFGVSANKQVGTISPSEIKISGKPTPSEVSDFINSLGTTEEIEPVFVKVEKGKLISTGGSNDSKIAAFKILGQDVPVVVIDGDYKGFTKIEDIFTKAKEEVKPAKSEKIEEDAADAGFSDIKLSKEAKTVVDNLSGYDRNEFIDKFYKEITSADPARKARADKVLKEITDSGMTLDSFYDKYNKYPHVAEQPQGNAGLYDIASKLQAKTLVGKDGATTLKFPDGNELKVTVKETSDTITLPNIEAKNSGTGLGTKFMDELKVYADKTGKKIEVVDAVNEDFFVRKTPWLKPTYGDEIGKTRFDYNPNVAEQPKGGKQDAPDLKTYFREPKSDIDKKNQEYLLDNLEKAEQDYRARVKQEYGVEHVVTADEAKYILPGFNAQESNEYHPASSAFSKYMYDVLLAERKDAASQTVLVLSGGTGSGKTTALRTWSELEEFSIIYDTNLTGDSANYKINKALDNDLSVKIVYVQRDPIVAFEKGVIPRVRTRGRIISITEHIERHLGAFSNLDQLKKSFDDRISVEYIDNTGGAGEAKGTEFDKLPKFDYTKEELRGILNEKLQQAITAGQITEQEGEALRGKERSAKPSGEPQQEPQSETDGLTLAPTKVKDSDEIVIESARLGLPESVLKQDKENNVSYARPKIGKTELKTIVNNSSEFKENPVLTVKKTPILDGEKTELVFDGEKIHFSIDAESMQLKAENLKDGEKITVDIKSLTGSEQQMRVNKNGSAYASTGSAKIGEFEKANIASPETELKLFEAVKDLVRKYATRIGEKQMPSKKAIGLYHPESGNIRTRGLNDFSTNIHELAHAIDIPNKISEQIMEVTGETPAGKPRYAPETSKTRQELTELFLKYYPGGRRGNPLKKRMVEGFATLVQKYVEMPSTIEKEFPGLVEDFIKEGGKFNNPLITSIVKEAQEIVSKYQALPALDKVGARVVNNNIETDKSFLTITDKIRTFMEDEVYPVEKLGKLGGTEWTGEDPSLWLRQYSRGGGIYANNILNKKAGYWSLDDNGEARKVHKYNWKNLLDRLEDAKTVDSFGYYLVARDQVSEWKELDNLEAKLADLQSAIDEEGGIEEAAKLTGENGETLADEYKAAKREYEDQKKYLDNNGFLREEVEQAHETNLERFKEEAEMYDNLVRADLDLAYNPQVQLIDKKAYQRYTAKEGYASMKRKIFDDIVGEEKRQAGAGTGSGKISSLKQRSGGQQQIINPVLSGMINHVEVTKKSIRQVVYNKIGGIAQRGTAGEILQRIELRSFRDDTGRTVYPQEKDPDIIMARINYKRVPILADMTIKNTVDNILTFQNMNIFEHLLVNAGRVFTVGTTGAYAPFAIANYPADQWNAAANTRNNYKPLADTIKIFGQALAGRGGKTAEYWAEWQIMGGDRMTLFQAQMDSTTNAVAYITEETNRLKKTIALMDKGIDIASLPAKYSETASRFAEYVAAREAGKHQVVALEEAGRITAPFHHIGSWKLGDRASGKYIVRSVPFANASLQVLAQTIRTAETSGGRKRLFFVLLAATAAYMASTYMISEFGEEDQKEQYKDLKPTDIGTFLHFPGVGGDGLYRVRISQQFTTIGTLLSMIYAENIFGTHYSADDYAQAVTNWLPSQINPIFPVEMMISWLNPAIKIPLELAFNKKDYPRIMDLESQSMLNLEPRDRYHEGTSKFAKALGNKFNLSPIKIDYLITGLFGRATGYLTGKPNVYNPISAVDRDYLFTLGRRVENFYEDSKKVDQQIKSLKTRYDGDDEPDMPGDVATRYDKLKEKQGLYNEFEKLLKEYRDIPQEDEKRLREGRDVLIPMLEEIQSIKVQ